jgi:hypothetical protein
MMRHFYPANLALLVALSSFATPGFAQTSSVPAPITRQAFAPSGWQDFRNAPGRFSVSFPSTPTPSHSNEGKPDAIYFFGADGSKGTYSVSYVDMASSADAQELLALMPKSLAEGFKGKIVQSRSISLGKHRGIETDFTTSFDSEYAKTGTGRFFAVDKRVYMVVGLGASQELKQFLNSFTLI